MYCFRGKNSLESDRNVPVVSGEEVELGDHRAMRGGGDGGSRSRLSWTTACSRHKRPLTEQARTAQQ